MLWNPHSSYLNSTNSILLYLLYPIPIHLAIIMFVHEHLIIFKHPYTLSLNT